jgi:hypothetical protein
MRSASCRTLRQSDDPPAMVDRKMASKCQACTATQALTSGDLTPGNQQLAHGPAAHSHLRRHARRRRGEPHGGTNSHADAQLLHVSAPLDAGRGACRRRENRESRGLTHWCMPLSTSKCSTSQPNIAQTTIPAYSQQMGWPQPEP